MTGRPSDHIPPELLLQASVDRLQNTHLRQLFEQDSERQQRFSMSACGLDLDYSKNRIDAETMAALHHWLRSSGFEQRQRQLLQGEPVNHTEKRAAAHFALRGLSRRRCLVDGKDVMPQVREQLARMGELVEAVRSGEWRGYTGRPIRHIVNIGIGGSGLGPKIVTEALTPYHADALTALYVSNADASEMFQVLRQCDPETTLFIVCSKSFATKETLSNATMARRWFISSGGNTAVLHRHFVAVTSNHRDANRFGIHPDQQYEMWDWVGGRFSLWSSIGLSTALMIGMERFYELLAGAEEMDQHFATAPQEQNMPVILALLSAWYRRYWQAHTQVVLPYDHYLRWLPEHLQQLDMESCGKSVNYRGQRTDYDTGSVLWGTAGSDGQHAYFQLLHQGTHLVPADFILVKNSHNPYGDSQRWLLASAVAQMEGLMRGKTPTEAAVELADSGLSDERIEELLPYCTFKGNRPSNALVMDKLTPSTLGALLALYEHKIFVQSVLWDINPFDQWGVEYGKQLARAIIDETECEHAAGLAEHDTSTQSLIDRLLK